MKKSSSSSKLPEDAKTIGPYDSIEQNSLEPASYQKGLWALNGKRRYREKSYNYSSVKFNPVQEYQTSVPKPQSSSSSSKRDRPQELRSSATDSFMNKLFVDEEGHMKLAWSFV